MPYIGRSLGDGVRARYIYAATSGQTTFSGNDCLLYTSPSPRDQRGSRMPSSA